MALCKGSVAFRVTSPAQNLKFSYYRVYGICFWSHDFKTGHYDTRLIYYGRYMHCILRTNIGSNAKALRVVLPMINRLSDLLRDLTTYEIDHRIKIILLWS